MRSKAEAEKIQAEHDAAWGKGSRTYLMPTADKFGELFDVATATTDKDKAPEPWQLPAWDAEPYDRKRTVDLGPYCRVELKADRFAPSLYVRATPELVEAIRPRYIASKHDRLTFQIIEWGNDTALVTYENSIILGGGYITQIDPRTIPGYADAGKAEAR